MEKIKMKTIRTYLIMCLSCRGQGYVLEPTQITSSSIMTCPACLGSKVVLVTETEEE